MAPVSKKILDIFPPKPPAVSRKEKPLIIPKGKKSKKINALIAVIVLLLITAGVLCQFVFARVEIIIWPETEVLNLEEKVTVDSKISQLNVSAKVIPGENIEEEKEISQEFPSSGKIKKEAKAQGQIRVYNAYSTSLQVLVANTRFISDTGKLFRSIKKVTIPGGKYEKGKLVPGTLDIQVVAAEAGEDYNIGPSTFSLPGLTGTERYYSVYGKSFSQMTGGLKGEVLQVTQGDLQIAKSILIDNLKKESKNSLLAKLSEDFVLLDETISQEVLEATGTAEAGAEVSSFAYRVKIKSKGLGFQKQNLDNFAEEFVGLKIAETQKIQPETLKVNFTPESINMNLGQIVLNLEISAKIYLDIDVVSIEKLILGKSIKETQILLENQPEVTKVEIKPWPFWLKNIPGDIKKTSLNLSFD
jgi:hypothetical protein